MANTLTGLIQTIYAALNVVSREQVGFIPAVSINSDVARAAIDQTVSVPIAPQGSLADNTPGVNAPDTGDQTASTVDITVSKSKHYPIRFTGEETLALNNSGNYNDFLRQSFEQAFRTLTNAIEVDLGSLYTSASRAYGTAGTTPFGTKEVMTDVAGVLQILEDNGAPRDDLQLVLNSAAWLNLRGKQTQLFKVNEAGTDAMLREGLMGRLEGFAMRQSAGVASHTKGTATGYDLNGNEAAGQTTLTVDGSDSGTILKGDVIKWTGYTDHQYVVADATHSASGAASGDIIINAPGLQEAIPTTTEGTTQADYKANLAFRRSAMILAARLPALPEGGDSADDRMTVTDPLSGLMFEVAMYRQYRQVHIEVGLAWGFKNIKPEHTAILLG